MEISPVWMHLLVNHVSIVGTFIGLAIVIVGLFMKSSVVKNVGLTVFVATGLTVYAAYLTGEPSEEAVENLSGISEQLIHNHEEAARWSLTAMSAALVLCLATLFYKPRKAIVRNAVLIAFLVTSVVAYAIIVKTSHDGGLIRRPDLNPSPTVNERNINHEHQH
jgi:uncharacterized membrane protein